MRSPVPFVASSKAASSWMVVPRGGGIVDSLLGGPAVAVEPVKDSLISSFGEPIAFALSVAFAAIAVTVCLVVLQSFSLASQNFSLPSVSLPSVSLPSVARAAPIVDETGKPAKAGAVKTVATAITGVVGFVLGMNV